MRARSKILLLTLGAGLGVILGCGDLDAALLDQECYSDADCGNLSCSIVHLEFGGVVFNQAALGWCADPGDSTGCVVGEQPYCSCALAPNPLCTGPGSTSNRVVTGLTPCQDPNDTSQCWCLPTAEADSCPFTEG